MYYLPSTLWAWVPLISWALLCAVSLTFAKWKIVAKFPVSKAFFAGPALTNAGAVSTVLSMIPLLLSDDVRKDTASASLLGDATLLFAFATMLASRLYALVAARTGADDKVMLENDALIAVQGVVNWSMTVAAACFLTFVVATPLLKHEPKALPHIAVTIKCDAKKCAVTPPSKD